MGDAKTGGACRNATRLSLMVYIWLTAVLAKSPNYQPPRSVATCLHNTSIMAAGPSELANILGWMTGGRYRSNQRSPVVGFNRLAAQRSLGCHTYRNLADRHHLCVGDYRKKARCREALYAKAPYEASCTGDLIGPAQGSISRTTGSRSSTVSETRCCIRLPMTRCSEGNV